MFQSPRLSRAIKAGSLSFRGRFLVGTGGLDHLPHAFCPEKPLSAPAHSARSPKYLPPRGVPSQGAFSYPRLGKFDEALQEALDGLLEAPV